MGQFNIRHLREKKGGFYWEPSASLKRLGYYSHPLGKNIAEAIKRAEHWNREADKTRKTLSEPDPNYGTLSWVIPRYKKSSRFKKLRASTQKGYKVHLDIIEKFAGDKHPRKLKAKLVERWYDKIRETTPSLANAVMRVLSILMEYAVLEELLDQNPVKKIRMVTVPPRQAVWNPEQLDSFLNMANKLSHPSMALAVRLAADTGQRQGDILSLIWKQFDNGAFHFKQSKTGELVTVPATPELQSVLAKTKRVSTHIIVSEATKQPYKGDHFRHLFSEVREKAGIGKELQYRDLRRTAVVRLALSGATVGEIISVTGHTLKSATNILSVYLPRHAQMAEHGIAKLVSFEAAKKSKESEL